MSQTTTLIAAGILVIALVILVLYYRAESREAASAPGRRPLPGRYFIAILISVTLLGMIITELRGTCYLSPWGFVTGLVLGLAAEAIAYLRSRHGTAKPA